MNLTTEDTMPLGKFKGFRLKTVLKTDPGYLVWLRETKKDQPHFFCTDVHRMLDAEIAKSEILRKRYQPWGVSKLSGTPAWPLPKNQSALAVSEVYGAWGQF